MNNDATDSLHTSVLMMSVMVVYSVQLGNGGVGGEGWPVLRWPESFSCTTTFSSLTLK